ncbi:MAG: hypothetical protein HY275_10660 [Gemmatimonadetes bacterium]|nr:hypothetical protein [Gemmatimonadota bacterium]
MTTHPRQAACPVALLAALLVACDAGGPAGPPQALTALPRPLSATESEALAGSANFGLGLLRETSAGAPGRNVVVSPLSASMALGMALNGAAAATRDSMRAVLGWGNRSDDEINAAYKGLATLLVSLDPQVRFTSANAVWINQGFPVLSPFVQVNRDAFGAQVANLDFTSGSAVGTVNRWVSGATSGRIPSIIDGFQSGDELLLVNALWFKGSWRDRFDPAN